MVKYVTKTDRNGVARFRTKYGDYTSTITKDGFKTATLDVPFTEDGQDFRVTFEHDIKPQLTILVYDKNEAPVKDALVTITETMGNEEHSATTNAEGKAIFEVSYGDYTVTTTKDGYKTVTTSITFDEDHTSSFVILEPDTKPQLTIFVIDEDSVGIPEALVRLEGDITVESLTNNDGETVFETDYGDYSVTTIKDGYKSVTTSITFTEEETFFVIPLESDTKPQLTILVTDENNEGISEALVRLEGETTVESLTDNEGRVIFETDYDDYTVTASKDSYYTSTKDITFDVNHTSFTIPLEAIPQTDTLHITVSDDDGVVEGATVRITKDSDEYTSTTDSSGVVEFQVEYGDYEATVTKDKYITSTETLAFRSNHKNFDINIEKEPVPSLTFIVVDDLDEPLEDVFVEIDTQTGYTDAEGRAIFEMEYGTYDYVMSKEGYKVTRGSVTFDADHTSVNVVMELDIKPQLTILVTNEDRTVIPEALVRLEGETTVESLTDNEGKAIFRIDFGDYTTIVSKDSYYTATKDITFDIDHTSFTIPLEAIPQTDTLHITVSDNDGVVEGATVRITKDSDEYTSTTDNEGVVEFQVEYGDYESTTTKNGYITNTKTLAFRNNHKNFDINIEKEPIPIGNVMTLVWDSSESPTIDTDTDRGHGIMISTDATAVIDWGDGTTTDFDQPTDFEHTYITRGTYTITVTILDGTVELLGRYCFSGRTGLKSISFPDGLNYLEESAFRECTNLETVTFHQDEETLSSFGSYAFYKCESLTSISIPDSVTELEQNCFEYCTSLTDIKLSNSITTLPLSCFLGCTSLTSFTVPESVTVIRGLCFSACSNLETFVGSENLEAIEGYALLGCTKLSSVTLSETTTFIGASCFAQCESLTSITLPSGLDYIYDGVFEASGLESIEIPASVTGLGEFTFAECTNLESITFLGDNVTEIYDYCFNGCTSLDNVDLPDSVTSLGESAFNGCSSLTTINLPDSITSMGADCFQDCTNLPRIHIPTNLTVLEDNTFLNCRTLNSVTIPIHVTRLGDDCFRNCKALTSINIPDSVTEIGRYCFAYCNNLADISLSENVNSLGTACFSECPITTLNIPPSVNSLSRIVYNCTSLTTLDLYWKTINVIPFPGRYDDDLNWAAITINVPAESWMDYASKGYPESSLHERT